jgi:single-strand DNA-binding protein
MQKIYIIGNVCADPEQRTIPSGKTVTTFTVAVSRKGDKDKTDFFRCSAWGKTGEVCGQYLSKGKKVCVIGEVSAHGYLDKSNEPKASLEVFVTEVEFLSPRSEEAPAPAPQTSRVQKPTSFEDAQFEEITDGDLPF